MSKPRSIDDLPERHGGAVKTGDHYEGVPLREVHRRWYRRTLTKHSKRQGRRRIRQSERAALKRSDYDLEWTIDDYEAEEIRVIEWFLCHST